MIVRFTRGKKGDVLTCLRDDGTTTWMAERPGFVYHDLAHYAVETVFGWRIGFFGLVESGWELSSSNFGRNTHTGERLPMPGAPEGPVEYVVGLFQSERRGNLRREDFRDALALYCPEALAQWSDERADQVRRRIRDLFAAWEAIPPGGSLELPFPDDRIAAAAAVAAPGSPGSAVSPACASS